MFAIFRPAKVLFMNYVLGISLAGVMLIAAAPQSSAQNSTELMATYGRGVHAYFNGQVHEADRLFSQVINGGSSDPRVFYFRAMARLRSGRQQEAEFDMQMGAAYEARNPGVRHQISRALQRVQGTHRRTLEKYRRQARLNRLQERRQQTRDRYEQLQQRESTVLRREAPVPLEQLVEPSLILPGQAGTAAAPAEVPPPTVTDSPPSEPAKPAQPLDPPAETDEDFDPFEEPADADDIFTDPEPAEDPVEEPGEDDPFASTPSDTTETSSDPFGAGATSDEPSTSTVLEAGDKVDSRQMAGILGRVMGSAMPWRGFEAPSLPVSDADPPEGLPGVDLAGGIEIGPFDEQSAVVTVSDEQPVEDPESTESPASAPTEDPFGDDASGVDGEAAEASVAESESEEESPHEEIDDPFADF